MAYRLDPSPSFGPSPRLERLGKEAFANGFLTFSTGSSWEQPFDETGFLSAPDILDRLPGLAAAFDRTARTLALPKDFYKKSPGERRLWLLKTALLHHTPPSLLPGDLLAGSRCRLMLARCLTKPETKSREKLALGKTGLLAAMAAYGAHSGSRAGLTGGRLIPDYPHLLSVGFSGIQAEIRVQYDLLNKKERDGAKGALLQTMMEAAQLPALLAEQYALYCGQLAETEPDESRKQELLVMQLGLSQLTREPPRTLYEAVQALWLAHLVLTAEGSGAAAGLSFGQIDAYLLPFWERSMQKGMSPAFGRDLLGCLLLHCAGVRDAGDGVSGPTCLAGAGQSFTLSGLSRDGTDLTNPVTYALLDAAEKLVQTDGPLVCLRLHPRSPEDLLPKAHGLLVRENVPLQFLFDRPAPIDKAPGEAPSAPVLAGPFGVPAGLGAWCAAAGEVSLPHALELALTDGRGLAAWGESPKRRPGKHDQPPATGMSEGLDSFETLYTAFCTQLGYLVRTAAGLCGRAAALRAMFSPAPCTGCLVPGCSDAMQDPVDGGGAVNYALLNGTGFATAVDALLAVDYLVYAQNICDLPTLVNALAEDWYGCELLLAAARYRTPKFGRDDGNAELLAARILQDFTNLVRQLPSTVADAAFVPVLWEKPVPAAPAFATPDGRRKGDPVSLGVTPSPDDPPQPLTGTLNSISAAMTLAGNPALPVCCSGKLPRGFASPENGPKRLGALLKGAAVAGCAGLRLTIEQTNGEPDGQMCREEEL